MDHAVFVLMAMFNRQVRKRRDDAEAEREEMDRLKAEESRLREQQQYGDWQKKEEHFHLKQATQRSKVKYHITTQPHTAVVRCIFSEKARLPTSRYTTAVSDLSGCTWYVACAVGSFWARVGVVFPDAPREEVYVLGHTRW